MLHVSALAVWVALIGTLGGKYRWLVLVSNAGWMDTAWSRPARKIPTEVRNR
jgi:hypothetical protein